MKIFYREIHIIIVFIFIFLFSNLYMIQSVNCETRQQDNPVKTTTQDSTGVTSGVTSGDEEMVLETIEIKGNVQKPGLIIMPKRVEPKLDKVDLERNFEREVNEGVGEIIKPEDEMNRVDRVKSIKKTVERERK